MNGNGNGKGASNGNGNGNGNGNTPTTTLTQTQTSQTNFEQPVVLRQSPRWSRAIIWTLIGVTTFGIGWAWFAKIEQVVPATGQLKPEGKVKEVQAPLSGKIDEVNIKDGDQVKEGQVLLTFDSKTTQQEINALTQVRNNLVAETLFYKRILNQPIPPDVPEQLKSVNLPPSIQSLTRNRAALIDENKFFKSLYNGQPLGAFRPEEQFRFQASVQEAFSRQKAAEFRLESLKKQFEQNQIQLQDAQARLQTENDILQDMQILVDVDENNQIIGEGISRLQFTRQVQEVRTRQADLNTRIEERDRIGYEIAQADAELANTRSITQKDVLDRIAENEKRIAEIDSQLNKIIVENQKQIADIDSRLTQAVQTAQYQALTAPVDGTIFDLQVGPESVANPSETLLKIVPGNKLIAEVFVTNQKIGFVDEDQKTDVRIASFPYSEFGDIKGKVIAIGSDALPPDEVYPFYRFPVQVELDQQQLIVNEGTENERPINLQSGMEVQVNIKVREDRTVLSLFTELFTDKIESLKEVN